MSAGVPSKLYSSAPVDSANAYREPQVAYSAELTVATREFAHSRASLEEILERHYGYVAKLRMVGEHPFCAGPCWPGGVDWCF